MRIQDVIDFIERWCHPGAALEYDNPGLQVGDASANLKNILVTLDVTDRIIEEAVENQVNLILSHHPLIFEPLSQLNVKTGLGRQISELVKNDIAVYAAHTNLDAAKDGVSIMLAKLLGVEDPTFLTPPEGAWMKKLAVFVPPTDVEAVRSAMAEVGAGMIGDYSHCSFNIPGEGTFLGGDSSSPAVGKKGALQSVEEIRLEMLLPGWCTDRVIAAMKKAHPYEEVAYDLYSLDNHDVNFGFGAIGNLTQPVPLKELLEQIRKKLGVKMLRVMEGPAEKVTQLAVCGGSGGQLIKNAWLRGAEVFLTGEMKYHTFLEYEDRLTVVVAGHYATERIILPIWVEKLQKWLADEPVSVIETKMLTNPVKYI
ncbi:Nif3-like dinuclear metal center hexameric protein [candidate division LCP-89 bacterium B3_LCP]|uniref:GTP cyclohydrolase 1 type 2 homolog n=1 Tax=candidate division LCP-89 bacterium B3_LCP TaxID=2012998 RepID=A0A532V2Q3_UNCL8|nr:MAG: Nif3-like dinuclear metal center hexameric protein [candidate division LCP-89 bacterium B3_LCP]